MLGFVNQKIAFIHNDYYVVETQALNVFIKDHNVQTTF